MTHFESDSGPGSIGEVFSGLHEIFGRVDEAALIIRSFRERIEASHGSLVTTLEGTTNPQAEAGTDAVAAALVEVDAALEAIAAARTSADEYLARSNGPALPDAQG